MFKLLFDATTLLFLVDKEDAIARKNSPVSNDLKISILS
jgi:hypothetical protein